MSREALHSVAHVSFYNLKYTLKDPVGAFFLLVLPFVLIAILGAVLTSESPNRMGIVDADRSSLSSAVVQRLEADGSVEVVRLSSPEELATKVRRQQLAAGLVLDPGFQRQVETGAPGALRFLIADATIVPRAVRLSVSDAVAAETRVLRAALAANGGAEPSSRLREYHAVAQRLERGQHLSLRVQEVAGGRGAVADGLDYAGPALVVFFLFVNALGSSPTLVYARRLGLTRRVLSGPTSAAVHILGEGAARVVVALFQAAVILTVGALAFGIDWGPPAGLALLMLGVAVLGAASCLLLSTLVKREEHAFLLTGPVGILLGVVGGCFVPLALAGPRVEAIGHLSPLAWAVDVGTRLTATDAPLASVLPSLAVLYAFALVAVLVAVRRFRRFLGATA